MASKGDNKGLIAVLLIAVIALAGIVLLSQPQQVLPQPPSIPPAPGVTPAVTPTPSAPSAAVNTGELELFLKSSTGTTGSSSKVLLLDKSEWKVDERNTRYSVMRTLYEKGSEGLAAYGGGVPKDITVSTGEWSESALSGSVGDQLVVFTYVDTSPGSAENASTAKLMTLRDFYRETGKWVAQTADGKSTWSLYDYGDYDWFDGTDTERNSYDYGDSGSADSNAIITWYSRADTTGQQLYDGVIYVTAPSNYTSKFKSLTITDKNGHSIKFTTMSKAENFAGDDYRSVAATKLSAAATNLYHYYVGDVPDDFISLYTTGDNNRLTWELKTDSYGVAVNTFWHIVQNGKAKIANNGPFEITDTNGFNMTFSAATSSTFR